MAAATQGQVRAVTVSDPFLEMVLTPYKMHCRYLKSASVEYEGREGATVSARGTFSIPESCYIADTGHFNAVDFNICYNQLAYCLLAQCIDLRLLDELSHWTLAGFQQRQLSGFLIAQFFSAFSSPLNPKSFHGDVGISEIFRNERTIFLKTNCRFHDGLGGHAKGGALLAIVDGAEAPQ